MSLAASWGLSYFCSVFGRSTVAFPTTHTWPTARWSRASTLADVIYPFGPEKLSFDDIHLAHSLMRDLKVDRDLTHARGGPFTHSPHSLGCGPSPQVPKLWRGGAPNDARARPEAGGLVGRAAWELGLSIREYRGIEAGTRRPGFETWDRICNLYGWSRSFGAQISTLASRPTPVRPSARFRGNRPLDEGRTE
jgi:hypothetical protein